MTKRQLVKELLRGERPPYVPWACAFTRGARARLCAALGTGDLHEAIDNHLLFLNHVLTRGAVPYLNAMEGGRVRDHFGVVWDRSRGEDVGQVEGCLLPEPTMRGATFPDPCDERFLAAVPELLARRGDCFRIFCISHSLYERAWQMHGLQNLLLDFYDHPAFVHELFEALGEWNIRLARNALTRFDLDAIYFGDDWGLQRGLQMGPGLWREFIYPVFARMCREVRAAVAYVFLHSCGNVTGLFEELIEMDVSCINPIQPEVMCMEDLLPRFRGRVVLHGGLSTQKTLPHGRPEDVRRETRRLLELGADGGCILGPSNCVTEDVPVENVMAFLEELWSQSGYASTNRREGIQAPDRR